MTEPNDDDAWFAPKSFGYGAGLPIRWQGWAFLLGHVGVIMLGVLLFHRNQTATIAWVMLIALLPMPLYAAKTRGGWHWRWGSRD
ncbi:MAG: hypothetical protein KGM18_08455 [Sphingomonadales bacterium]|nr:hypothetical protein [Sphingomonadales bacterium]